jgi:NitT/TauT family transport system substrate-binding protein
LAILAALLFFPSRHPNSPPVVSGAQPLHLGYFPNVTHAPAVVGVADGEFQKALGAGITLVPRVFNAGPEEMEALLAGEIDLGYVGPGPAIDTFLRSQGRALRVIAGACSGGAALVARADTPILAIRDLNGKRVAVPQLGGTQDISLRHFMSVQGLQPQDKGGSVQILPVKNPDILVLFKRKELDAAWVPEPWASRLIKDANARLVVDERDLWPDRKFPSTVVIARTAYLEQHPEAVRAFLQAHLRTIDWLQKNPSQAQAAVNAELKRLLSKGLAPDVLTSAWNRVSFTADPDRTSLEAFVRASADAGYIKPGEVDVAKMVDLTGLQQAQVAAKP